MKYIVILLMIFFSLKVSSRNVSDVCLEKEKSTKLRGILAILIILTHISQKLNDSVVCKITAIVGYLYVSIFFLYSGYGIAKSYIKSPVEYKKNFIIKRFPKVIMPFLLAFLIYFIKGYIFDGNIDFFKSLLYLFSSKSIVTFSWYVTALLILYTLFFVVIHITSNTKQQVKLMWAMVGIYSIVALLLKVNTYWYKSIIAFCIGISIGMNENFPNVFKKRKISIGIYSIIFIFLGMLVEKYLYNLNIIVLIIFQFSTSLFVITFYNFEKFISIRFNKIWLFIGSISFEIYLYHGLFLNIFKSSKIMINNNIIYVALVYMSTITMSYLMNKLNKKINNVIEA